MLSVWTSLKICRLVEALFRLKLLQKLYKSKILQSGEESVTQPLHRDKNLDRIIYRERSKSLTNKLWREEKVKYKVGQKVKEYVREYVIENDEESVKERKKVRKKESRKDKR